MTPLALKEIVIKSLSKLCEDDYLLIESSVKEECINHKFAQYVESFIKQSFDGIDVDVEYDKYKKVDPKIMEGKPIRPDIIAHKRQSGDLNYLAIEAKKRYSSGRDKRKIKHLVTNLNYKLGCLVSYQPDRSYLIIQFITQDSECFEILYYEKTPFMKIEK
ncbi:MAG: hypothetical protein LWW74_03100 [Burkholderiales bacterium]|nr:hypothetical protein [Burkholderiales bacterium]MCE1176695.1 hypothetical protein [Burkholderiales bacterium]